MFFTFSTRATTITNKYIIYIKGKNEYFDK